MKIVIIGFAKIKYMPYVNFYIEQIVKLGNEVHLLYWNRDGKEDIRINNNIILHEFNLLQKDEIPKTKKIHGFLRFRDYAKRLIKQEKYELIIVLQPNPGILLIDVLKFSYKNKYILDIRDLLITKSIVYKKLIDSLVKNSKATFISSDGYRKMINANNKLFTTHNIIVESLNFRNVRKGKSRDISPIRISFWGIIRDEAINKSIIRSLANDSRFELHYYGREQEIAYNLKEYCISIGVTNIFFHGEYTPEERYIFSENTEILHNCYENIEGSNPSMGNKYYDGLVFYIPQICTSESYMGKQAEIAKVGIMCDPYRNSFADDIYNYYKSIDWTEFEMNCNIELEKVFKQYNESKKILQELN